MHFIYGFTHLIRSYFVLAWQRSIGLSLKKKKKDINLEYTYRPTYLHKRRQRNYVKKYILLLCFQYLLVSHNGYNLRLIYYYNL